MAARIRLAWLVAVTYLANGSCCYWQGGENPLKRRRKH